MKSSKKGAGSILNQRAFLFLIVALYVSPPLAAAELFCPDASDMFNERGFGDGGALGGTAFSSVNAQSGTVFYSQPLFRAKGANGFVLKVDLNHVSSLQHVVFNQLGTSAATIPKAFNLNEPEWIISVNNIAVQVLNFEEDVYSTVNDESTGITSGANISRLVKGYHFSGGGLGLFEGLEHLSILKGDGGLFNLVQNTFDGYDGVTGAFDNDCSYGLYISSSRGSFTKAHMTRGTNMACPTEIAGCGTICNCASGGNPLGYNCWEHGIGFGTRQLTVFPGDGTRILYEETFSNLNYEGDMPFDDLAIDHPSANMARLRTFYPVKLSDHQGNVVTFEYEDVPGFGHKKLKRINTSWNYTIEVGACDPTGCDVSDAKKKYILSPLVDHPTSEEVLYVANILQTGSVSSANFQEETTQIEYAAGPVRRLRNLPQNFLGEAVRPTQIEFPLYGVSSFSYPSGLVESFEYLDANAAEVDLEIDYSNYAQRVEDNFSQGRHRLSYVSFHSPYYYNEGSTSSPSYMGRDLAFQKMVSLRKIDPGQATSIRYEEYSYGICTEDCDKTQYGIGAIDTSVNWDVVGWPWYTVDGVTYPTAAEMLTTTQINTRGPDRFGDVEKVQEQVYRTVFFKHTSNSPDHRTLKIRDRIWDKNQETLLKEVQTAYSFGTEYTALPTNGPWWNTYCADNPCTLKPSHIKTTLDGATYDEYVHYDMMPAGYVGHDYETSSGIPLGSSHLPNWFAMDLLRVVKTNALGQREIIHYNYNFSKHPQNENDHYHAALPAFTLIDTGQGTPIAALTSYTYHSGSDALGHKGQLHKMHRRTELSDTAYQYLPDWRPFQNVMANPNVDASIDYITSIDSGLAETRIYSNGLLSQITDPKGTVTAFLYNEMPLVGIKAYHSSATSEYSWNPAERARARFPVKTIYDYGTANSITTSSDYDVYGNRTFFVDSEGMLTAFVYGLKNRISHIIKPYDFSVGYTTKYQYYDNQDGNGFRVQKTSRIENKMCFIEVQQ